LARGVLFWGSVRRRPRLFLSYIGAEGAGRPRDQLADYYHKHAMKN